MTPAERKADRILATKPWVNPPHETWVETATQILNGGIAHITWRGQKQDWRTMILLCGRTEPAWKAVVAGSGCRRCAVCDAVWKMILAIAALERSVS